MDFTLEIRRNQSVCPADARLFFANVEGSDSLKSLELLLTGACWESVYQPVCVCVGEGVGGGFRQRSYGRGYKYSCRVLGLCAAAGLQPAVSCSSVSTLAVVGLVGCNCQSVVCGFSSPAAKLSTEVRGGGSSPSKKTTPILAFKLIFSSSSSSALRESRVWTAAEADVP